MFLLHNTLLLATELLLLTQQWYQTWLIGAASNMEITSLRNQHLNIINLSHIIVTFLISSTIFHIVVAFQCLRSYVNEWGTCRGLLGNVNEQLKTITFSPLFSGFSSPISELGGHLWEVFLLNRFVWYHHILSARTLKVKWARLRNF